tara:strand:+ start:605 stop:709 length:105 start_codon:yes stop_codon:yes gene_type:complete
LNYLVPYNYILKIDEIEFLTEGPVSPTVKQKVYL